MNNILNDKDINELLSNNRIILLRGNYIYDVTDFKDHPGSYKLLIDKNGQDISRDYNFHKNKGVFKKYLIGVKKKKDCYCTIL